jgi:thiosulfate/3-mercaptopyruvate sulfurtransferase
LKLKPIIDPEEVLALKEQGEQILFIDARNGPNAKEEYAASHIEGAIFADINENFTKKDFDPAYGGRHPLPDVDVFAKYLGSIGIVPSTRVIVYDDKSGANAAARVWWMLRAAGHQNVQVLSGGLDAAIAAKLPISSIAPRISPAPPYHFNAWKLETADINEVASVSNKPNYLVIDVRETFRYNGEREPIDPVAGHIPGAVNIPYSANLGPDGKFLASGELLAKYASELGGIPADHVIIHCGSGITACHTILAMEQAGLHGAKLYVGSWSEWCRSGRTISTEV